jgi:hypothetical protein
LRVPNSNLTGHGDESSQPEDLASKIDIDLTPLRVDANEMPALSSFPDNPIRRVYG